VDPEVEVLVRDQRLVEAAELAASRGDPHTASALFERACDFARAAECAIAAREWSRALPLALEGKREDLADRAAIPLRDDPAGAERVAFHLERRGDHGWAARLYEGIGKRTEAARAFERAGEAIRAAQLLEADSDVVGAAPLHV
jgi:hypothetical protein